MQKKLSKVVPMLTSLAVQALVAEWSHLVSVFGTTFRVTINKDDEFALKSILGAFARLTPCFLAAHIKEERAQATNKTKN